MSPALTHEYADLGDVRLHYVTGGQGDTVVLLHGWPQTCFMWRKVLPGLTERYRVVAPDLRGLGDSSRPATGYDKKTVSNDVWRLLTEVIGVDRFFVVGHDWGGPVSYSLAAQHRDAVRRMAIFDVPVPGDGTTVFFDNRWHHGLHWEPDFAEALTVGREEVYLGYFYRTWGARPDVISPEEQQEYLRTYRLPGAMRAGFSFYRAMPQDVIDNQAFLAQGKLKMPILSWAGGSARGRRETAMESWQRVAEDVRGGVLAGAGHWIPEEQPEWVVAQLLAFFGEER
ncbi:MAG: alpha/beta hydrolase [Burkholderiales bacterium]